MSPSRLSMRTPPAEGLDRRAAGRHPLRPRSSDGLLLSAGHLSGFRYLECVQQLYRRANGRVFGGNRFPNLLVGSRAGPQRPKIVLAPRSPGFDDPSRPKIFVHFWSRGYLNPTTADRVTDGLPPEVEQPNIGMNQMLVNLDIVIGEGNPGAIAVRHQAAEGSAIEDCTIDATTA
jgi:hypothetical protein